MNSVARGVVLAAVFVLGACGGSSVNEENLAKMRKVYDETLIEAEPLCIAAGPFPFRSGMRSDYASGQNCDRCQALAEAGFLVRTVVGDGGSGYVQFDLSDEGRPLYRREADAEYVALVHERLARFNRPDEDVDPEKLGKPRLCFGQTRFHSIADALSPFSFSGSVLRSVKVVAEAKDTSGVLFDPRVKALGLPVPEQPEPGEPALYPPHVVTFEYYPGEPLPGITDTRYGAWVDEP